MKSVIFSNVVGDLFVDMEAGNVTAVQIRYQNSAANCSLTPINLVDGQLFQLMLTNEGPNTVNLKVTGQQTDDKTPVIFVAYYNSSITVLSKQFLPVPIGISTATFCAAYIIPGVASNVYCNVILG